MTPTRSEIFLYDTNIASPSPVQLTNDVNYTNELPYTDGRHFAWVRTNVSGSPVPELILGGAQISSGNFVLLSGNLEPFNLDRGQLSRR